MEKKSVSKGIQMYNLMNQSLTRLVTLRLQTSDLPAWFETWNTMYEGCPNFSLQVYISPMLLMLCFSGELVDSPRTKDRF